MTKYLLFVSLFIVICKTEVPEAPSFEWNYGRFGPDVWFKKYPECAGENQSPINIKTACTIYQQFEPFHFSAAYYDSLKFTLVHDGHSVKGVPIGRKLFLSGGNLNGTFTFINFHLHWGPNENVGSEHQVNGRKYTGESHFVFENEQTNQLAVLGFFLKDLSHLDLSKKPLDFHQNKETTDEWKQYFDSTLILHHRHNITTASLNLSLLMSNNLNDFWRYEGSLTIPPCNEIVVWTIFSQPIYLFDYEFKVFREDFFFESFRGPQNLYYRQIYRSFPDEIISLIQIGRAHV